MAQDDPSSIMSEALAELAGLLLGAESFDDLAEQIAQLVGEQCLGALNVYARTPYAFTAQDMETIAALSRLTTAGFAGALRGSQDLTLADHLLAALLNSRQVIDHAIGIIIGQQHCTPEQAFAALGTISQTRNVRLRDIGGSWSGAPSDHNRPPAKAEVA